jgi:hypothetical protein
MAATGNSYQNEMSNSHRRPSIDASYHVSVHLAKLFQGRRFLEIDQSETRIACGGHVCSKTWKEASMEGPL